MCPHSHMFSHSFSYTHIPYIIHPHTHTQMHTHAYTLAHTSYNIYTHTHMHTSLIELILGNSPRTTLFHSSTPRDRRAHRIIPQEACPGALGTPTQLCMKSYCSREQLPPETSQTVSLGGRFPSALAAQRGPHFFCSFSTDTRPSSSGRQQALLFFGLGMGPVVGAVSGVGVTRLWPGTHTEVVQGPTEVHTGPLFLKPKQLASVFPLALTSLSLC